ncbi:MAG: hypothetical protein JST32_21325, partial [Bacteroidetes bacterium]|nr:hypothetical protein [Bacteroidota bacterium]
DSASSVTNATTISLGTRHGIKDSIKGKMLRCLMNTNFLKEVLTFQGD